MHLPPKAPLVVMLSILVSAVAAALAFEPPDAAQQKSRALSRDELIDLAKQVQGEVEELRGWEFKRPVKTDVRTEEQLRAFLLNLFETEYGGGLLERKQAFLRMVGLIPPDADVRKTFVDVLLNQVGGFYDNHTKSFYMLIREGIPSSELVNRILIAHELTHALDDQYLDLERLTRPDLTEDKSLSYGAVVEGSATVLMTRYMTQVDFDDGSADELTRVMEAEMQRAALLRQVPRYFTALVANYICGMNFMLHGDLTGLYRPDASEWMQKNVLQAGKHPPQSTEQVLHPEKYWNAQLRDEPVMVDDEPIERLLEEGSDRSVVHRDTVGELFCALLTQPADEPFDILALSLAPAWTNEAAGGWGGDRFYLLASSRTEERAGPDLKDPRGLWITAWDTADDCDEFVEDYNAYREMPARDMIRFAPRVALFFFNLPDAERVRIAEGLRRGALRLSQSGKPWSPEGD